MNNLTRNFILPAAVLLALLAGCGQAAEPTETAAPAPTAASTPSPTPVPTPEPTPEPVREITLTGAESPEEILALSEIGTLERLDATASDCYDALLALQEALPGCEIDWVVDLDGTEVHCAETALTLEGGELSAQELSDRLAWLPNLETVDLTALSRYTNDEVDALFLTRYPEIRFVWTVHMAGVLVRSDATIFSTMPTWPFSYQTYTDEDLAPLFRYCTDMVALDMGHQNIKDLSPILNMPHLRYLILADDQLTDISALAGLTELEYLELFLNYAVEDFTPLNSLTKMVDLNLSYCPGLHDLSFLENMPDLEMGWFTQDEATIPRSEQEKALEEHPDAEFIFQLGRWSTGDGWRTTEKNLCVRKAFANWNHVVEFRDWDDVTYEEGVELIEVKPMLT